MLKNRVGKFGWEEDDLIFEEEKPSVSMDQPKPKLKNGFDDFERIKEKLGVAEKK
jgi:hypothetical protein